MLCDCCHVDRPAELFRTRNDKKGGLHTTCNRCHAAQERKRRGGLKRLMLELPPDLCGPVGELLDKTGETPAEFAERAVRKLLKSK